MSVVPSIALVAWAERTGDFIFVKVPNERGRYLRTDSCVAHVACPWCKSIPGEPCKSNSRKYYGSGTHSDRRRAFQDKYRNRGDEMRTDVVEKPHFVYKGTRLRRDAGEQRG